MELSDFCLSRDLIYASGILTGIVLGFLTSLLKKNTGLRFRNRRITLILLFLSLMIVTLAAAAMVSMGAIFGERRVLAVAALFIPVCAAAVYFPRAAAYPLILFGGLAAVWLAYSCLRFPPVSDNAAALISSGGGGSFSVRIFPGGGAKTNESGSAGGAPDRGYGGQVFYTPGGVSFLKFSVIVIEIDRLFPLAGGTGRFIIQEIGTDTGLVFFDNSLEGPVLKRWYRWIASGPRGARLGISCQSLSNTYNLAGITPGTDLPVLVSQLTGQTE